MGGGGRGCYMDGGGEMLHHVGVDRGWSGRSQVMKSWWIYTTMAIVTPPVSLYQSGWVASPPLRLRFLSVRPREHVLREELHAASCPTPSPQPESPATSDAPGGLLEDEASVGQGLHDVGDVPAVICKDKERKNEG